VDRDGEGLLSCRAALSGPGRFAQRVLRLPGPAGVDPHHTDRRLPVLVRASHEASRRTYGSSRVAQDLASQDIHVGRKRVIRLMQGEGLQGRVRRRYRSTTMSDHDQPVAANVLNQDFTATAPNERCQNRSPDSPRAYSGRSF